MSPNRQLHLNAFLQFVGHHEAAWRVTSASDTAGWDVDHFRDLAQIAERGKFDAIFFGDSPAAFGSEHSELGFRPLGRLDPTILLATLGASTESIGLIATASTTYTEPYELARRLASLDHVTKGRAGWNIVTTSSPYAAANFGLSDHPSPADRYARATEFLDVARALWDSWPTEAILADRRTGHYADTEAINAIDHHGKHFSVAGPLNVPRSPQGHPVLVQAGSSTTGVEFAASYAEAVFTAQLDRAASATFSQRLRHAVSTKGRDPESVLVLPGLVPILGSTQAEALAAKERLSEAVVPASLLPPVSRLLGTELTEADLDRRLTPADVSEAARTASRSALISDLLAGNPLTVRELINRYAAGRAHLEIVGTPEHVADVIEEWFVSGAANGFNIMAPVFPEGLEVFVDQVVPILQSRGLFRRDYEGDTLRHHYGIDVPQRRRAA